MELAKLFTDADLESIITEAMIYQCACPAQVAEQVLRLRRLHAYQSECIDSQPGNDTIHRLIADTARDTHQRMEQCLDTLLDIEGWNRQNWKMPAGLRALRDDQV
jgi:hypothetical protein